MRQGLTSKVSFSNWVLGGPLVTVTKNDIPEPRARGARRVVITEVDSVCLPSLSSGLSAVSPYII
jgi:hypothetical protein